MVAQHPRSCDACLGWLAALRHPRLGDDGQWHLDVPSRIAADLRSLRMVWFAQDRAAVLAARAAGEDDLVPMLLSGGSCAKVCLECLVSTPCPICERFGPKGSLLDWDDIVAGEVDP